MERSNVQHMPACNIATLALWKNIKAIQLSPVKIRQIFPRYCTAKARWAHEPFDPKGGKQRHIQLGILQDKNNKKTSFGYHASYAKLCREL